MFRIESLLSARLFLVPQLVADHIYFISNLNGRNSLYRMRNGGSVPQPLLPANIALQNPHLIDGRSFIVFPRLEKILVLIDQDGNEDYLPALIPMDGGYPEFIFSDTFAGHSVNMFNEDLAQNRVYFLTQSRSEALFTTYLANLETAELEKISQGMYGMFPMGINQADDQFILADQFGMGDVGTVPGQPCRQNAAPLLRRHPGTAAGGPAGRTHRHSQHPFCGGRYGRYLAKPSSLTTATAWPTCRSTIPTR
jgi:hypothetical protein